MSSQIQLYYKNVLAEAVGPEHGLTKDELNGLAESIGRITEQMASDRMPYRDLPYRDGYVQ